MDIQIKKEEIDLFWKQYHKKQHDIEIRKNIAKKGIIEVSRTQQQEEYSFNLELPEAKRHNQQQSYICWIYAGLNTIRYNIAKNLNIETTKLELSANYLAFFDKLEKSNTAYENMLHLNTTDLKYIHKNRIMNYCVDQGGYWEFFVNLVKKYGIIPASAMPDTYDAMHSIELTRLYNTKVRKDILQLLELKKQGKSMKEIRDTKRKFLQQNYEILAKLMGEPPLTFDYEYNNKEGKTIQLNHLSGLEFKKRFLTLPIEEFVDIGNYPMYSKKYYKRYVLDYTASIYEKSKFTYLNLPIEEIKELVLKQLKDGIPIYFLCAYEMGIGRMEEVQYQYEELLGIHKMTKQEALDTEMTEPEHVMTIVGVNLVDGKPNRWKIEDTFGIERGNDGYFSLSDEQFEPFILNSIIHKKHLSQKQLNALEQKPIRFGKVELN